MTKKQPKALTLELNYFENGYLYGSIKPEAWEKMPRSLWLKLNIAFTSAYLHHDVFGKQARADICKWLKELHGLENI
jgi:hypothetical protein